MLTKYKRGEFDFEEELQKELQKDLKEFKDQNTAVGRECLDDLEEVKISLQEELSKIEDLKDYYLREYEDFNLDTKQNTPRYQIMNNFAMTPPNSPRVQDWRYDEQEPNMVAWLKHKKSFFETCATLALLRLNRQMNLNIYFIERLLNLYPDLFTSDENQKLLELSTTMKQKRNEFREEFNTMLKLVEGNNIDLDSKKMLFQDINGILNVEQENARKLKEEACKWYQSLYLPHEEYLKILDTINKRARQQYLEDGMFMKNFDKEFDDFYKKNPNKELQQDKNSGMQFIFNEDQSEILSQDNYYEEDYDEEDNLFIDLFNKNSSVSARNNKRKLNENLKKYENKLQQQKLKLLEFQNTQDQLIKRQQDIKHQMFQSATNIDLSYLLIHLYYLGDENLKRGNLSLNILVKESEELNLLLFDDINSNSEFEKILNLKQLRSLTT